MSVMSSEEGQMQLGEERTRTLRSVSWITEKVKEARLEEVQCMQEKVLWDVVRWPQDGCPVSVRWVDVVKSDGSTRSRLVARDFKGVPSALGRLVRSYTTFVSSEGCLEHGSYDEWRRTCEEGNDNRCQEGTLDSALHRGRLHCELPVEVGAEPGQCGKLNVMAARIPQGGVGVGGFFVPT